jgi:hypothetical protein
MKTATKKIVTTKSGAINKSVANMINHCRFANGKIYTGYYLGSGRFTSAQSASSTITAILDAQGYKYSKGNDAPKGGITGEYLKVSKTAEKFILSIK